jgi:hypothetical protein
MDLGSLTLDRTFGGWLMSRGFYPHLFYQSGVSPRLSVLSWEDQGPPAWRCGKCGTVVFPGRRK